MSELRPIPSPDAPLGDGDIASAMSLPSEDSIDLRPRAGRGILPASLRGWMWYGHATESTIESI